MEPSLPIEPPKSYDSYHDSLTHHYSATVFYDALKREISFAKREGNSVAVLKFQLHKLATSDHMIFFANELELSVRQHDLISRISEREFVVLLRFDSDISSACECLVARIQNVEKRTFYYGWVVSDGTKDVLEVLNELDNPHLLRSSKDS